MEVAHRATAGSHAWNADHFDARAVSVASPQTGSDGPFLRSRSLDLAGWRDLARGLIEDSSDLVVAGLPLPSREELTPD